MVTLLAKLDWPVTVSADVPAPRVMLLPLAACWAFTPHPDESALTAAGLAALILAFLGVLTAVGRQQHAVFQESCRIRFAEQRLNRELEAAIGRETEAHRAKTQFLAAASHDLRQPIHSMNMLVAALALRELEPRAREIARLLASVSQTLSGQLDALLDISRLDAGTVQPALTPVRLDELAASHHQALQPVATARGLDCTLAAGPALPVRTDAALLLSELRRQQPDARIDWVGTSMGGLIGMALAAQPALAIGRLVLNDVGPIIQIEALQRIGAYLGQAPAFESQQQAIDYLASISLGFGPHTPDQWRALSLPMLRERDGRWHLHYDPALALPVKALLQSPNPEEAVRQGEAALWQLYDAIRCPTLLLRGAQSDLLSEATVAQMQGRGPHPTCVRFDGVGHAPTLVADDQIAAVRDFLWAA